LSEENRERGREQRGRERKEESVLVEERQSDARSCTNYRRDSQRGVYPSRIRERLDRRLMNLLDRRGSAKSLVTAMRGGLGTHPLEFVSLS
jgi:hypothetical protein